MPTFVLFSMFEVVYIKGRPADMSSLHNAYCYAVLFSVRSNVVICIQGVKTFTTG